MEVLQSMMKNKEARLFLEPVDPVRNNAPDYFEKITHPMDFGTIQSKLEANVYPSLDCFIADVNLVFDNCTFYNPDGNWAYKKAIFMKKEFERLAEDLNFAFFLSPSNLEKIQFNSLMKRNADTNISD